MATQVGQWIGLRGACVRTSLSDVVPSNYVPITAAPKMPTGRIQGAIARVAPSVNVRGGPVCGLRYAHL